MINNPVLPSPAAGASGNSGVTFLQNAIPAFIRLGFVVGSVVFLFIIIIGAIQWISSGGDKQALESAKGKVSNAIIGLVVLFAIFAILNLINIFFKVDILNITLPTLNDVSPGGGGGGGGKHLLI